MRESFTVRVSPVTRTTYLQVGDLVFYEGDLQNKKLEIEWPNATTEQYEVRWIADTPFVLVMYNTAPLRVLLGELSQVPNVKAQVVREE